jgi:choline-sulfatase
VPNSPNVLFLMADQLRADTLGFVGDDVVRTPNLDELAEDACVFSNAYTPSPVCVPGRQAMMAGQLPTTCDCWTYGMDLDPGYQTFARQFAEHGYTTTCAGKLHHRGFDQMQGWRRRIGYDTYVGGHGHDGDPEETGFELTDEAIERYGGGSQRPTFTNQAQEATGGHSEQNGRDEYTVQGAKQFVREFFQGPYHSYDGPDDDSPLLFKVSLEQPHPPFITDDDRFEYYLNRVEPYLEENPDHPLNELQGSLAVGEAHTARTVRRATAAYYGMIETIDHQYGQVMDALEYAGVDLDEWIIVFTSDHGEQLGEGGMWAKLSAHEASWNVPLMIRWPEEFDGRRIEANVSTCDLYATLCSLAGLPVPDGLDSRDLTPLLTGDEETWHDRYRDEAVGEIEGRRVMIKWGDRKYVYDRDTDAEFLFDLADDPEERTNLIDTDQQDLSAFRERRDELGYGAEGDPRMVDAGYA